MDNILITGITGSGGSYLAEYILEEHPLNRVRDNLHRSYILDYSQCCKENQDLHFLYL